MGVRDQDGQRPPWRRLGTSLLAFTSLLMMPAGAPAQSPGLAFWDLPGPKQEAMLQQVPATDAGRYAALRKSFDEFGCDSTHLTEQPVPGKSGNKNLLCTLPGQYPTPIVVAAWYPDRALYGGASHAWPEAVMLPMLYHALQAQPRHFTIIFAALAGAEGERAFVDAISNGRVAQPYAMVGLDALGTGAPRFFAIPANSVASNRRKVADTLNAEAWHLARLQGFAQEQEYVDDMNLPNPSVLPSKLLNGLKDLPRILLYSDFSLAITPAAFHREFEFAAFYLCAVDIRLDPISQTFE
jgi:hypothetical protein